MAVVDVYQEVCSMAQTVEDVHVKCWNQTQGDRGYIKEGLVINSDGFLQHQARGVPTPDLVVLVFQR